MTEKNTQYQVDVSDVDTRLILFALDVTLKKSLPIKIRATMSELRQRILKELPEDFTSTIQ